MDKKELEALEKVVIEKLANAKTEYTNALHIIKLAKEGVAAYEKPAVTHYTGLPKPTHFMIKEGGEWYNWNITSYNGTNYIDTTITDRVNAHAIKFEGGAIFDMVNGWRKDAQSIESVPMLNRCIYCDAVSSGTEPISHAASCPELLGQEKLVPRYEDQGQPRGQDKPSIPDCAYLNKNDGELHSRYTGEIMDAGFRARWNDRKHEFTSNCFITDTISTDQRIVSRALLETVLDRLLYFGRGDIGIDDVDKFHSVIKELQQTLQTEKSELKASSPIKDVCTSYRSLIYRGICQNCGNSREAHSG